MSKRRRRRALHLTVLQLGLFVALAAACRPEAGTGSADHATVTDLTMPGGDLPVASLDLASPSADLAVGATDLLTASNDLTIAGLDLATPNGDLAVGSADLLAVDLATQSDDLAVGSADLLTGSDDLTIVSVDLATQSDDLAASDLTPLADDLATTDLVVALPSFTFDATPKMLSFPVDQALDLDVSIVRELGFAADVTISFPSLPSTLHATGTTLSGATTTAKITIDSDQVFTPQSGTFVVRATSGLIVREVTVGYSLLASVDYAISVEPISLSVSRGTTGVVKVKVDRINGYNGTVTVTAPAPPEGVGIAPLSIAGAFAEGTLTIDVTPSAEVGGPISLILSGAASPNGIPTTRETTLQLTITPEPSFVLDVSPAIVTVAQGSSAAATLTIARDVGFTETLTSQLLTPPSGVTASGGSFASSDLVSTLTVSATSTALLLVPTGATVSTGGASATQTKGVTINVVPAADPFLDTSFGIGGANVYIPLGLNRNLMGGRVLASGKARAVENDAVLTFNSDGTLDTSWGAFGTVQHTLTAWAQCGFVAADGDAFAATRVGAETHVARVLSSGSLDASFGTGGVAKIPFAATLSGIAERGDGSLFIYGQISNGTNTDLAIVKLTSSGAPDVSFGGTGDGIVVVDTGGDENLVSVNFVAGDKIVLIGGSAVGATSSLVLVRLTAAGALDTTFDNDGIKKLSNGTRNGAEASVQLASGAFLIVGRANSNNLQVARVLESGVLDPTFGTDGFAVSTELANFAVTSVAEDAMNRLVLGGRIGSPARYTIARLTSAGAVDTTFSIDGIDAIAGGTGTTEAVQTVSVDGNGRYWTFGRLGPRAATARFLPSEL